MENTEEEVKIFKVMVEEYSSKGSDEMEDLSSWKKEKCDDWKENNETMSDIEYSEQENDWVEELTQN
ncbi:4425_t:CDS:2 [Dentiscutata erythropus]|uniref:4425_t:CDS:1 n=1 Tax=Dentiscutata erythropus TaxID=1348616 RepID=A0A9N9GYL7_9GLOM|nr:4425_t:CDS:2 [Dentiscutata erythropus]